MLWHQEFLRSVATAASQVADASFAQNGFWADHWTYTLDLVENYLLVYPGSRNHPMLFYQKQAALATRSPPFRRLASIVNNRMLLNVTPLSPVAGIHHHPSTENKEYLMFDSEPVPFFQSPGQVNPRDGKYVVRKGQHFSRSHLHACSLRSPHLFFSSFDSHLFLSRFVVRKMHIECKPFHQSWTNADLHTKQSRRS